MSAANRSRKRIAIQNGAHRDRRVEVLDFAADFLLAADWAPERAGTVVMCAQLLRNRAKEEREGQHG